MTPPKQNARDLKELQQIATQVVKIEKRLKILQTRIKGEDMDQIIAAIGRISRASDALIAKGQGSLTPAQVQTITDDLTTLAAKIEAAAA